MAARPSSVGRSAAERGPRGPLTKVAGTVLRGQTTNGACAETDGQRGGGGELGYGRRGGGGRENGRLATG
ncbi:unnamed protein product, partial [Closterium sp. NIES-53]